MFNTMQVIILSLHASSTPGVASKHFCLKVDMLNIKVKEIKHTITYKQIFCPYTLPQGLVGFKGHSIFFFDSSHLTFQMNRKVCPAHTIVFYSIGGLGEKGFL